MLFSREGPNGERIPPPPAQIKAAHVEGEVSEELLARAEGAMIPAPPRMIEEWLAELSVITAKRADDDFSEELRLTAYTNRLAEYPADIVRHALLVHTWKFWPTWSELSDVCELLTSKRRAMIKALRNPSKNPEQKAEPLSDEERLRRSQRLGDLLAELRVKGEAGG